MALRPGHRFELLACLSWVKEFWTNCEGGYGVVIDEDGGESELFLPQALVDDVAACVRHLVASFDNFIKTHRRAHSLTGTHLSQVCVGDDSASFASVSSS